MYLCRKYICQSLMMMWYDVIELFKSSGNFRVLGVQMASEGSGRGRSLFRTEGLPLPLIHGFFFEVPQGHQLPGNKALVEGRYKLGQGQWVKNPLYPDGGKWDNPNSMICMIYSSTFVIQIINLPEYKTVENIEISRYIFWLWVFREILIRHDIYEYYAMIAIDS